MIHLLGFPHSDLNDEFAHCAYTQRTRDTATMLTRAGLDVRLYAGDGSDAEATEHIALTTAGERRAWWPGYEPKRDVRGRIMGVATFVASDPRHRGAISMPFNPTPQGVSRSPEHRAAISAGMLGRKRGPYRKVDPQVRFWAKVDASGDCWEWTGALHWFGYGMFRVLGRTVTAYWFAYTTLVGPVPVGLELDHLCRSQRCVNPDHLEPVTHAENIRRGRWGRLRRWAA